MFAGNFDSEIDVVDEIALNRDVCSTVDVDAIGTPAVLGIRRVVVGCDVVNRVLGDSAVACLVIGRVGRSAFKSDYVDADVVVVVNEIIGDGESVDVAVECERFTASGFEVIEFVAGKSDVVERAGGLVTVERYAQGIGAASGG